MKHIITLFVLVALVTSATISMAADAITLISNKKVTGKIISMDKDFVTISLSGLKDRYPTGDIVTITYDGAPAQFSTIRSNMSEGKYDEALEIVEKMGNGGLASQVLVMERDFLKAQCMTKDAFDRGRTTLKKAADEMAGFLSKNKDYYRYYEACELYGEINVQMKKFDIAAKSFEQLENSKSVILQVRGKLGRAKALVSQGMEPQTALKLFDEIIKIKNTGVLKGDLANSIDLSCNLGIARCYTLQKKFTEAKKLVQDVISKSLPSDIVTNAMAYNTLGIALESEEKFKDAILAFLHTELLYNSDLTLRVEALTHLKDLWMKLGYNDRSKAAADSLKVITGS